MVNMLNAIVATIVNDTAMGEGGRSTRNSSTNDMADSTKS